MPVVVEARTIEQASELTSKVSDRDCLDIALLNNLGDSGLAGGEHQFISLLDGASHDMVVRLKLYSLPQIKRSEATRERMRGLYSSVTNLLGGRADGLIVTGAEPKCPELANEPYWHGLTQIIDWAEHHTTSTIWSCLAAHAAVLHLDGIKRKPRERKLSGIYSYDRMGQHPLLAGFDMNDTHNVPHSRYNDISRKTLEAHGYQILTYSPEIGVDTFVKKWESLFVYLQGHIEYDPASLTREYRRDVLRFLRGESGTYPGIPENYFRSDVEAALRSFELRARFERTPDTMFSFPVTIMGEGLKRETWRASASQLIRNWLLYLRANKA